VTPVPHLIADYDRARHEAFVLASWEGRWPGRPPKRDRNVMADLLRSPGVRCVVAHHPESPDDLYGWAAVEAGVVLWSYVRALHQLRRHGLGTSLLVALGVDPAAKTPCRYWSPLGAAWAARPGVSLYYAPEGHERNAA